MVAKDATYQPLEHLPAQHGWQGPDDLHDVLRLLFSSDPSRRPTIREFMQVIDDVMDSKGENNLDCHYYILY